MTGLHFHDGDRVQTDDGRVGTVDHSFRLSDGCRIGGAMMPPGAYCAVAFDGGDCLPVPQSRLAPYIDLSPVNDAEPLVLTIPAERGGLQASIWLPRIVAGGIVCVGAWATLVLLGVLE